MEKVYVRHHGILITAYQMDRLNDRWSYGLLENGLAPKDQPAGRSFEFNSADLAIDSATNVIDQILEDRITRAACGCSLTA